MKPERITVRLGSTLRDRVECACKIVRVDSPTIMRALLEAFVEEVEVNGRICWPLVIEPAPPTKALTPAN